ncbi:MAG: serine/threonine protein kinase [Bifidobacteriaceae bacterium]|nr:serine/threonine protein kinase [Bifidobacteriaceae bacterium]
MNLNYELLCYGCFKEKTAPICPHCGFDPAAPGSFPLAMPLGTILDGRYLVGRALGQGGFGITYLGFDLTLQVRVAVKEYMPTGLIGRDQDHTSVLLLSQRHESDFESNKAKFLDEARILAQLGDAPNIVKVQNFFLENNTAYFTMEYVEGRSLKEEVAVRGGRMDWSSAVGYLMPIAEALHRVHSASLLHRDISPDNIVLTPAGQSKLLDFGAARFASGDDRSLSVILKHGFAPEEQYRSHGDQGPWTDVYALAATLYWCLVGTAPPGALDRLHQDSIRPPSALGVTLPPAGEVALMRALAIRAGDRIQSMDQFAAALNGRPLPPLAAAAPVVGPGPVGYGPTMATQLVSAPQPGAELAPFGAGVGAARRPNSFWSKIARSKVALTAVVGGGVLVVAGLAVAVALALSGSDKHDSTTAGGGGIPGGGRTASSSPSPSTEPQARKYTADALGVSFEVPEGWSVVEEDGQVLATAPSELAMVGVTYDPAFTMAMVAADPDSLAAAIAEGAGAGSYELGTTELLESIGDYQWQQISFTQGQGDEWAMVNTYTTDSGAGGAYLVFDVAVMETPDSELAPGVDVIASFQILSAGGSGDDSSPKPQGNAFCEAWTDFLSQGGAYDPDTFEPITQAETSRWLALGDSAPAAVKGVIDAINENITYMGRGDYSGAEKYLADVRDVEGYVKANCP